ncbi:MAG: hypothetical protein AAF366_01430 [Pseudomonadota bacterium]
MSADQFNHSDDMNTGDFDGEIIVSPDPEISKIEPIFVPFNSIKELKGLIGTPDSAFSEGKMSDRFIDYPTAPPPDRISLLAKAKDACDFDWQASPDEFHGAHKAAESYIMGNSAKVAAWEPMLNARFGVGRLAVFAAKNVVIGKDEKFVVKPDPNDPLAPVKLNFQSVTVEEGGQFVIEAKVDLSTLTFTVKD